MPQPISRTRVRVNICPESVNTPPPTPRPHFPALEFKSVESEFMIVSLELDLTILLIFSCSEFNPTESELLDYSQAFKGRVTLPNRKNFRKSSTGGGGGCWSFSFQKFILQILGLYKGLFPYVFRKKLQYNFPKMRGGGSKVIWNFSENSSYLVA